MKINKKKKLEIGVTVLVIISLVSVGVTQGLAETGEKLETDNQKGVIVSAEPMSEEETGGSGTEENAVNKSETVYVIADASGAVEDIIVSDQIENAEGLKVLNDRSDLADIENIEGYEEFSQDGETVVWEANGNDIHYQGTSDKELPVSVHITYYLDGKEITPEKLAGQSGKVTIRCDYTNREMQSVGTEDGNEKVYVPFTVMTGMVFTDNCAKNVEINSGKVITKDDTTIVAGVAFPGLQESLEIKENQGSELELDFDIPDYVEVTMEAENFTMETTASLVMSDIFSGLDLDSMDGKDELQDAIEELTDGAQELEDGSNDLADGVGELYEKIPDLTDGIQELKDGVVEYTDGVSSVQSGVWELKNGSSQLVDGALELSSGADGLASGAGTLADGAKALASGSTDLKKGVSGAKTGTEQLLDGYSGEQGAVAGAKSLADGAEQLDSGMDALVSGADTLIAGAGTLVGGITGIQEGAISLDKGAEALQQGAAALVQGTEQMSSSSGQLATGLENTSQALAELQVKLEGERENQTSGIIEELKAVLEQISSVVGDDTEGAYSLHNCYENITADIQILYGYYSNENTEEVAETSQESIIVGEGSNADVAELREAASSSKESAQTLAAQAETGSEQMQSAFNNAKENLETAKSARETAGAEAASADGLYQNALSAYTPMISSIKDTLNNIGLSKYAGYVDDGQGTASAIAGSYQSAAGTYETAAGNYEAAVENYASAAAVYQETTESYQAAIESYEKTIEDYEAVIAQYEEMLAAQTGTVVSVSEEKADEGVTEQQIQAAWTDLLANLQILGAIEGGNAETQVPGLTASIEELKNSLIGDGEKNAGILGELTNVIDQLYEGVGDTETTDGNTLLGGARILNAGSIQLATGVNSLSGGIDDLKTGTSALTEGTEKLGAGATSIVEGADTFAAGVKNAKTGSSQLSQGAGQLSLGIQKLYAGTKELDSGMSDLASGADNLSAGAKTLSSGAKELSNGADALASGTGSLVSGSKELDNGVSTLQSGVSELSSNSPKLVDGVGELSDGADELSDGVSELKDGAEELRDGMEEFNEEGIQKLEDIFIDDMDKMIERLRLLQDMGNDYKSFTGITDEMNGDVKFIIKTDGILKE